MGCGNGIGVKKRTEKRRQNSPMTVWAGRRESPAQVRQVSNQWRIAFSTFIDDREIQVVQGTRGGRPPVNLYFNEESGLLVRLVRFSDTPIGRVPTQIDYADYREVSGVMMPFHRIVTWTTGQSIIELTAVRPNVPIDGARFARPAPAEPINAQ